MIVLKNARIISEFQGEYAEIIIKEEKIFEILSAKSANYSLECESISKTLCP